MRYNFEWDPKKAIANRRKHGVGFELAATVFKDPNALTVFDDDHSVTEDRWITMGSTSAATLLVVHHTFQLADEDTAIIRIISSRKAGRNEERQYHEERI